MTMKIFKIYILQYKINVTDVFPKWQRMKQ